MSDHTSRDDGPELEALLASLSGDERLLLRRLLLRWRQRPLAHGQPFDEPGLFHQILKTDPRFPEMPQTPIPGSLLEPWCTQLPDADPVALPEPSHTLNMTLSEVLQERTSRQQYTGEPLTLTALSTFLYQSYGVHDFVSAYTMARFPRRMAPSSGGLQAVLLGLIVNQVSGLEPGLYVYDALAHTLRPLLKKAMKEYLARCSPLPFVRDAPLVCAFVGDLNRLRWKYGARAYRAIHLDSGVLLQNMYLVGTALELHTCAISAYYDDLVNALLGLDGTTAFTLLLFTLG